MEVAINFSIISGWFPVTVVTVAIVSMVLSVAWRKGKWKRQLLITLPVSVVVYFLLLLVLHIFDVLEPGTPTSAYFWLYLFVFALVNAVDDEFIHVGWPTRVISVLSVFFTLVAALTIINQTFGYYPTLDRLFGREAENFGNIAQLKQMRDQVRTTHKLPTEGVTVSVAIPPTQSHFNARDAYIWLPPAWFGAAQPELPILELAHGTPGSPSDWTRAAYADQSANDFAEHHNGMAPILVMPDINGSLTGDSECVNSKLVGNVETYLTKDVLNYMKKDFNANVSPGHVATAGYSEGGTCASSLALANPDIYHAFADYSGYTDLTYQADSVPATIQTLFGGSSSDFNAHDPVVLIKSKHYSNMSGWFASGQQDEPSLSDMKALAAAAPAAGISTCLQLKPGAHSFQYWQVAFQDSLPWLSWKVGLTPEPKDLAGATCTAGH
jgi:enterochelin esterase-like enzyme